ncbi:MAG: hypothetical protein MRY64_11640 [Hyphomonadaceae bacterium]|nr:hypothetical protein [Hyphomonadaceae bacterium]
MGRNVKQLLLVLAILLGTAGFFTAIIMDHLRAVVIATVWLTAVAVYWLVFGRFGAADPSGENRPTSDPNQFGGFDP